ncbi:MAG: SDR family NAD(P)-dependent oxidoreductase [Myxococcota bacterium]|nr:SDR family NAD(P)-dependent oxidoreductase [Myxococcota bacterium]
MRVLVTGGAGFIGSHIAEALLARGDEVVVLDDLSNGRREHVPEGAVFVEGDVRSPDDVDRAFSGLGAGVLDAVCHLAGQASTFRSFDEPSWDMEVNGLGTARVLEGARKHGTTTFLFASSMTAYGRPPGLPVTEEMPCDPISYYGVTKWAAERAVVVSGRDAPGDMRAVAFRMFNVYGERQSLTNPYQGVLGIFVGRVLRGEPIELHGDGEQSRDFVYAGDVAQAWLAGLDAPPETPAVLNIGTGTRISINQLWRAAVQACGADPDTWPVQRTPNRPGDQRHMQADISRAREILGWEPTVTLEEGLRRTVEWARSDEGSRPRGGPAA